MTRRGIVAALGAAVVAGASQQEPAAMSVGGGDMADEAAQHRVRYYAGPLSDRPDPGVEGRVWEVVDPGAPEHGTVAFDDGSSWDGFARVPADHDHAGDALSPDSVAASSGSFSDSLTAEGVRPHPLVNQYTGDGTTTGRTFDVGFEPSLVVLVDDDNRSFVFCASAAWAAVVVPEPGLLFSDTVNETTAVKLTGSGFTVGDGAEAGNRSGVTYSVFASEGAVGAITEV